MNDDGITCSFCGKNKREHGVRVVPGPAVYICEECVAVCVQHLAETEIKVRDAGDELTRLRAIEAAAKAWVEAEDASDAEWMNPMLRIALRQRLCALRDLVRGEVQS